MNKRRNNARLSKFNKDADFYFRVGIKYFAKKDRSMCLKFLKKAVNIEPNNAEYKFSLAIILAKANRLQESNVVLNDIVNNIDVSFSECYFAMGCNYFDMRNFSEAKASFQKYVDINPNGEFTYDANDILYCLKIYENIRAKEDEIRTIYAMSIHARERLKQGASDQCVEVLERAIECNPEINASWNNLSLAYFYNGNIKKAIFLSKSVLLKEPNNIDANCNLLLFYWQKRNKKLYEKQLGVLSCIKPAKQEDIYKLLDTFIRLNQHFYICRLLLKRVNSINQIGLFHILAISLFNMMQFGYACKIWRRMIAVFPSCESVVANYIDIALKTQQSLQPFKELDYVENLLIDDGGVAGQMLSGHAMFDSGFKEKMHEDKFKDNK